MINFYKKVSNLTIFLLGNIIFCIKHDYLYIKIIIIDTGGVMISIEKNYTGKLLVLHIGSVKLKVKISNLIFKLPVKLIDTILPKDNRKIIFISEPDFSDNAKVYYEYLYREHKNEFKFVWLYKKELDKSILKKLNKNFPCKKYYWGTIKGVFNMITAKYHVITHANVKYNDLINLKRHAVINLWHGSPIKTLGVNEKGISNKLLKAYKQLGANSFFFVTSDIFKLSMISCFLIPDNKIFITGQPRTDCIVSTKNLNIIETFLPVNKFEKVILYTPTYKEAYRRRNNGKDIDKAFNNIFYMDDYCNDDFSRYLKERNILFVIKPHPFDENFYREYFITKKIGMSENIRLIFNDDLLNKNLYFYELFQYSDLLITDFSSISIDYLITGKPVIYLDNLTEEYQKNRGFILENNFEILLCGEKVKTYAELLFAIENAFNKKNDTGDAKLKYLHKYFDNNSSQRVYEIMKNL